MMVMTFLIDDNDYVSDDSTLQRQCGHSQCKYIYIYIKYFAQFICLDKIAG